MMQMMLPEKVAAFVQEQGLFSAPCHVLVAVSGGADSMALLHLLMGWRDKGICVDAVHVHHGLRGDAADRDERFVRDFCDSNHVPLTVCHRDVAAVASQTGQSIEEAGRSVRYACFEQTRLTVGADYVVTAHTADDQAETMLMRFIRGTGTDGLAGIPAVRGVVRRPLLCCRREEIEAYCRGVGLTYCTDETNFDRQYTRNRIRHDVLPLLREINPGVDEALLRLSTHIRQDVSYLKTVAERVDGSSLDDRCSAPITQVMEQPPAVRSRVIRGWFDQVEIPSYEQPHIRAVDHLLMTGHGSVSLCGGFTARVDFGHITFSSNKSAAATIPAITVTDLPATVIVDGVEGRLMVVEKDQLSNVHKLFSNAICDYDKIQGNLTLRSRLAGDTLHPAGRGIGKSLKKLMNEWQIPADKRDGILLICDEQGIVLIPGYTCDERVRAGEDTKHFLVWQTAAEQG